MLYAVKGNKQLKIDEAEKETYLKLGYDIAEQHGDELKVIKDAPTKSVSWKDHQAVVAENADLKEQLAAAGSGTPEAMKGLQTQLDDALKENKTLKEKLAEANKKLKDTVKE